MAAPTDVLSRIDEIEGELRGLSAELHELRALVTQAAVAPAAPLPSRRGRHPWPSAAPVRPPVAAARRSGSAPRGRDRRRADPSLRGRAERRARRARACDRVLAYRPAGSACGSSRSSTGIARYQSSVRTRAGELAEVGARRGGRGREHAAPSARPCRRRSRRGSGGRRASGCAVSATPAIQAACEARRTAAQLAWRTGICSARVASRSSAAPSPPSASSCSSCSPRTAAGSRPRCASRSAPASRRQPSASLLGAVALRPAADVARRRRRRHRGWLRDARRRRRALRPRAGLARAPARGRHRARRRRDRDRVVVRDRGRDRAARGGARARPAGDRHGALLALRRVRRDRPRCDRGSRRAAPLARCC